MDLQRLADALSDAGLVTDPTVEDTFVHGRTYLPGADAEVNLNVDPEADEHPDAELGALVERAAGILAITATQWRDVVEQVASEIEDAVGDEAVAERTDLRDDLVIRSVVVLADTVLLSFEAAVQFPGGAIRVQLDDDLQVEDLEVDGAAAVPRDETETVVFDDLDDLLDHLTAET